MTINLIQSKIFRTFLDVAQRPEAGSLVRIHASEASGVVVCMAAMLARQRATKTLGSMAADRKR